MLSILTILSLIYIYIYSIYVYIISLNHVLYMCPSLVGVLFGVPIWGSYGCVYNWGIRRHFHMYGHVTGKWSSNPLELGIYHFPNSKSNESKVIIENLWIPWKFLSFLISKPYLRPSQDVWVRLSVPTSRPRRPSAPVAPTPLLWASWTHRLGVKLRAGQLMCWEWWCYPINEGF